jgi:hypothetical protein
MKTYSKPKSLAKSYPAELVWAAATTAFRINGGYNKTPVYSESGELTAPTNRSLVEKFLAEPSLITEADRATGLKCRQALGQDVTLRALKGSLSEFDQTTVQMYSLAEVNTSYQMAVIASMPKVYERLCSRASLQDRLNDCVKDPVGLVGHKVELNVEIVSAFYSQRFFTWFLTAITASNQAVFFSYRESLPIGWHYDIRGNVKGFNDKGTTQLNRVKLINQE